MSLSILTNLDRPIIYAHTKLSRIEKGLHFCDFTALDSLVLNIIGWRNIAKFLPAFFRTSIFKIGNFFYVSDFEILNQVFRKLSNLCRY